MTLTDVLEKIRKDLSWEGPSGRKMGHVVLTRAEADYLHKTTMGIILERDRLVFEKDCLARGTAQPEGDRAVPPAGV